ncbi:MULTISPECIES: hypothetical protein [Ensifer]|uniref:Uncharacterized protein n=1 Tax=Ensifer adhaerens TaxID=106592 RepID=A0A9Q8YBG3_ENSAD|nr:MULTISPECIES: hypothetical protein [Ensifer]MBD9557536.1 hypothetical protein [Ensifer sp. ENS03]MBW0368791.1 hypothetical protein [Ensifer adhaerens]UCM23316.1 hypothetical protein LDL63_26685 [Ensifer adhaerens]USJ26145.1 hypothetical protein NE863_19430 [Ensifer adhaerens]
MRITSPTGRRRFLHRLKTSKLRRLISQTTTANISIQTGLACVSAHANVLTAVNRVDVSSINAKPGQ